MSDLRLPYYFPGNKTGCLLIHGFTSTPAELRIMGEALHKKGYSVYGILLAGHGTMPDDMLTVSSEDWIECAQQGVNELKKQCNRVIVIGHSMGGLLALQMAARNKIAGLVTIAAAIKPFNRLSALAWLFKHFQKYTSLPQGEWPSEQKKYLLHYPYFPVSAAAELHRLAVHTRRILPQITANALIIQTKDDETVRPESASIIYHNISSQEKECLWLDGGTHNVPVVPPYNQQMMTRITEFIEEL